jgi:hypothetical protein
MLVTVNVVPSSSILSTLMLVAIRSSETSVLTRAIGIIGRVLHLQVTANVVPCLSFFPPWCWRRRSSETSVLTRAISIYSQSTSVASYCKCCFCFAESFPPDGGDTVLRNVGSYKSHTCLFSEYFRCKLLQTLFLARRFFPPWWWRWYVPTKRRFFKNHKA